MSGKAALGLESECLDGQPGVAAHKLSFSFLCFLSGAGRAEVVNSPFGNHNVLISRVEIKQLFPHLYIIFIKLIKIVKKNHKELEPLCWKKKEKFIGQKE